MIRQAEAQFLRLIDADTFDSLLDIGWGVVLRPRGQYGGAGTIRIVFPDGTGYDAPEMNTTKGKEAKSFIARFLTPGMKLPILSHGLDDFGRTLASVTLPAEEDWATLLTKFGFVK